MTDEGDIERDKVDVMRKYFPACEELGVFGKTVLSDQEGHITDDPLISAMVARMEYDEDYGFLKPPQKLKVAQIVRNFINDNSAEAGFLISLVGGHAQELIETGNPTKHRDVDVQLLPKFEDQIAEINYARDFVIFIQEKYKEIIHEARGSGELVIMDKDAIIFEIYFTDLDNTLPVDKVPFYSEFTQRGENSVWKPSLRLHVIYNGNGVKIRIVRRSLAIDTPLVEIGNPVVIKGKSNQAKPDDSIQVIPAIRYDEDRRKCLVFDPDSKSWIVVANNQEIDKKLLDPFTRMMMFVRHLQHTGKYDLKELEDLDVDYLCGGIEVEDQFSDPVHLLFLRRLYRHLRSIMVSRNYRNVFAENNFALLKKFYPLLYHAFGLGYENSESRSQLIEILLNRPEFDSFTSVVSFSSSRLITLEKNKPLLSPNIHEDRILIFLRDAVNNALMRNSFRYMASETGKNLGLFFEKEIIQSITGMPYQNMDGNIQSESIVTSRYSLHPRKFRRRPIGTRFSNRPSRRIR